MTTHHAACMYGSVLLDGVPHRLGVALQFFDHGVCSSVRRLARCATSRLRWAPCVVVGQCLVPCEVKPRCRLHLCACTVA